MPMCVINTWQSLSCPVTNRVAEWGEAACSEKNNVLETIIDITVWETGPIHLYRKRRNTQKYTQYNSHTHTAITHVSFVHTPYHSLFNNVHVEQWDVLLPNMANLIS